MKTQSQDEPQGLSVAHAVPRPRDVRAVLFDMDGVLTVNGPFHVEAWGRFAREHLGLDLAPDDPRIHGGRNADILAALTGREPDAETLRACDEAKEGAYRALARGRLLPVPGLHPYLDRLTGLGIPIALVTSADRVNASFVLDELGLMDRFLTRITAEDVSRGKPNPEPYLCAAALLGVAPTACLVHEDAPAGVCSALAAGCEVVALTTTLSAAVLSRAGARHIVPDFETWLATLEENFGVVAPRAE